MDEGTSRVATIDQPTGRVAAPWLVWNHLPEPLRVPTRALIALTRRRMAHRTRVPTGVMPELPVTAVELRTRYGSFWFDGADSKVTPWIRRHATWEQDVLRYLGSVVRPGMTVVDVGANVGFHTVSLARLVGPAGRVYAFEPLEPTLQLLTANLWRHGCANTTVHAAAVLDRTGRVWIEPDPEGFSGAHLSEQGFEVDAVRLDDVLGDAVVDVMKIDVEGAEPLVLEGAAELIARSPRLNAVVEFRGHTHLDGRSPEDVLELYETLGLQTCLLRADGRTQPATHERVLDAAKRVETLNIILRRR